MDTGSLFFKSVLSIAQQLIAALAWLSALGFCIFKRNCATFSYDMVEIDSYTLAHAGKVYADTLEGVLGEAGDILQPIDRGEYSKDRLTGELGQLINGVTPGRESDSEITFFKSVGSAVLDLVAARRIYAKAKEMGIGLKVEM